ncbi:MAG: SMC family ATPase, partial [Anaerolineales bacterium]|nr:SMC family ATPase [Anaerolineales bacterium]
NKTALEELASDLTNLESQLSNLASAADEHLTHATTVSQLTERLETMQRTVADWESVGMPRLAEIPFNLQHDSFAPQARAHLAEVDKELADLGYDALAHDAVRRSEVEGRAAEADFRNLESARAALKPLDDEIANLHSSINNQQSAISHQQAEYDSAVAIFTAAQAQAPDLEFVERALFDLQEQENRLNQEVGAARQKVAVLDGLRARKVRLEAERGEFGLAIGRFKSLERAFGKDGVPALLIEQALPEIESKANDLLDRLSNGTMSVRFVTQSAYKDKNREDLRETLNIQISDGAGGRDYEMFSGGEAFRVNFAIRLALSGVLAQRKGARLQTLVIDEGFGSQDAQGRQRLIEAINAVRGDFAKILIITHLDELKDVFPTRIEVEKTDKGSTVSVF